MTIVLLVEAVVAVLVFAALRKASVRTRVVVAAATFIVLAGATVTLVVLVGDRPAPGSVDVPSEVLSVPETS